MDNDQLVLNSLQHSNATGAYTPQLASLLALMMQGTRELEALELSLWKATLADYRIDDVEAAVLRFLRTATRADARGVVLGDLVAVLDDVVKERVSRERDRCAMSERDVWRREYERDPATEADFQHFRDTFARVVAKAKMSR